MYEIDSCIRHYRNLIALLEDEMNSVNVAFQGEVAEKYKAVIATELNILREQIQSMYYL